MFVLAHSCLISSTTQDGVMEEDNKDPSEINSADVNKVLQSSFVYLNKKRKFQAGQSSLPLPKHKCWDRTSSSEAQSNENLRVEDFNILLSKGKTVVGARDNESELESAQGSNSFGGNSDSAMSISGEAKIQLEFFKNSLYSLESRSFTKSGADRVQQPYIGGDHNFPHNDFGLHACLNFDEHLLEYGTHIDFNCLELGNENIEECTDKEVEDMLCSDGPSPNNYVLSSGRWSVNQETPPSPKKLTIDKEFEQYFSMLML